jgi:hypothetical protein
MLRLLLGYDRIEICWDEDWDMLGLGLGYPGIGIEYAGIGNAIR